MPLDVIMPALGMAQDTGLIVAWHKKPGDPVAEGDVLFEVETDKATMEVEAAGSGFLTDVTASEGDDVPVGKVIARISETAEGAGTAAPEASPEPAAAEPTEASADQDEPLPEGHHVIMPTLGMAQDSGLLVAWHVAPGDEVEEGAVLFEVETDKSTMEVEADRAGFIAAILADEGEDVPTGQTIAILSAAPVEKPLRRSAQKAAAPEPKPEPVAETAPPAPKATAPVPAPQKAPARASAATTSGGRVLASPKARRLALEAGIDLRRVTASAPGHPVRAADVEAFRARGASGAASRILTAEVPAAGFAAFADFAAREAGLTDDLALLAGLAAPGLGQDTVVVGVERAGEVTTYAVAGAALADVTPQDGATPDLLLRDLRGLRIATAALGGEPHPVITLGERGNSLVLTLECDPAAMAAEASVHLLSELAGRLEEPLRHLL